MVRGISGRCQPLLRGHGCGEVRSILSAAASAGGSADISIMKVLMWAEEPGFANIDLSRIAASYDPQHGLLLTVPYALYDLKAVRHGKSGTFRVRIDLRDADPVTIEQ